MTPFPSDPIPVILLTMMAFCLLAMNCCLKTLIDLQGGEIKRLEGRIEELEGDE